MTDYSELKRLAEAATPGRNFDRLPMAGGGLKYECTGDDGSLVLKVDHKNDEWGFVGYNSAADEEFFLACTPAEVLALISENERLTACREALTKERAAQMRQRDRLKAENEALRANSSLAVLLPELDSALEDLEIHGRHSDQGYRKLKDWYRKVDLACKAIDAAMGKGEQS